MKLSVSAYKLLNNLLIILDEYMEMTLKNLQYDNQTNYTLLCSYLDYQKYFSIYKNSKNLYKTLLTPESAKDFAEFYYQIIEKNGNFSGCLNMIKQFYMFNSVLQTQSKEKEFEKCFYSSMTRERLEETEKEYVGEYYDNEETKKKRIYKMEHAGINWTQEDISKFNEGMKLYGHYQLANIKIAKYMGPHIEASHVKLFRSQISKEKRMKRKIEKMSKISEMKKKRYLKWKVMEADVLVDS